MKKPNDPKKPNEVPDFAPADTNEIADRTFERDGVRVQLDPLTKRALDKTAKRLEDDDASE